MARKTWIDPRFLIGTVLVIASIAGVWLVVEAATRTTRVWVASATLLPGEVISARDVTAVDLRMDEVAGIYLTSTTSPEGLVVVRTIGDGEALPISALGDAVSAERTRVVLALDGGVPSGLDTGDRVDVWAAAPGAQGVFEPPNVLVDGAIVVGIAEDEGLIGSDAVNVEVLVPSDATGAVLDAVANAHALSIVPIAVEVSAP